MAYLCAIANCLPEADIHCTLITTQKMNIKYMFVCLLMVLSASTYGQSSTTIKVYGNCGMCQDRIETTAKNVLVGHDTDQVKATDDVYENLHSCCKYDRPGAADTPDAPDAKTAVTNPEPVTSPHTFTV